MKKIVLAIALVFICSMARADNSVRIKELTDEGNKILQERQQVTQYLANMEKRIIEIQAIIKELQEQDKPKPEPKTEEKK